MVLYIYFVAFLIVIFNQKSNATDVFNFQDCSKNSGIVTVYNMSMTPHPISLSGITRITAEATLHQDIPEGAVVKTKIYKVTSLFGIPISIPIPCIDGYGSCSTEHCKFLRTLEIVCPFFPKGEKCDCPVKANKYGGYNVAMKLPKLGTLAKTLASGHFKFELRVVTKGAAKELFCISATGKIIP